MTEKMKAKKLAIAVGAFALAAVLLAGVYFFGGRAGAAARTASAPLNPAVPATALKTTSEYVTMTNKGNGDDLPERGAGTLARWDGNSWEYSSDGGETWMDTPPDGITEGADGSLQFGQVQGDEGSSRFESDAWQQTIDNLLASILKEVDDQLNEIMPEGYQEWGSFFSFGDTIARQTNDGAWEFSTDSGKTWTDETPDGFSYNEDGTRFTFGYFNGSEDGILGNESFQNEKTGQPMAI